MSTTGREVIGRCEYDLLFADNKHPVDVCHVTLAAGAKHKKGEVLEIIDNGKCDILGTTALGKPENGETAAEGEINAEQSTSEAGETVAGYILAADVDATDAEVVTTAYRSGHFIRNALIVKDGYSLTEKDETQLRNGGIYLSDAMI